MSNNAPLENPSKDKRPSYVTFSQKYDPKYWDGWDPSLIESQDVSAIGAEVVKRYESAGGKARGAWFITHDRDKSEDGSKADPHIHGIIQQSSGRAVAGKLFAGEIDSALGFSGSVARVPNRGGRIENAQAYLIHAKEDPEVKVPYRVSEVVTIRGEDYAKIEKKHGRKWYRWGTLEREASTSQSDWVTLGDNLVQKAIDKEIMSVSMIYENDIYTDIYARNKGRIDVAFDIRKDKFRDSEVQKLKRKEFRKLMFWTTGETRSGKTYLLNELDFKVADLFGWETFKPAAKNSADGYLGEAFFSLNEVDKNAFDWRGLLALTDPADWGPLPARYKNTKSVAPRLTSFGLITDPVEYAFKVPGAMGSGDKIDQFLYRIGLFIQAFRYDPLSETEEARYAICEVAYAKSFMHPVELPKEPGEPSTNQYGEKKTHHEWVDLQAKPDLKFMDMTAEETMAIIIEKLLERSPDLKNEKVISYLNDPRWERAKSEGQKRADRYRELLAEYSKSKKLHGYSQTYQIPWDGPYPKREDLLRGQDFHVWPEKQIRVMAFQQLRKETEGVNISAELKNGQQEKGYRS